MKKLSFFHTPSAFVIGRNDWVVGKINHIGGLQNGEVHLQ